MRVASGAEELPVSITESHPWIRSLRRSAVPYLSVVVVATLLARFMPFLVRDDVRIKGQPLQIAVELIVFPLAIVLWAVYQGSPARNRWLRTFLIAMIAAWTVRLALSVVHGDLFNHLVWLTPIFLAMLLWKTPSWRDAWTSLIVLGWVLAGILVVAYVLEVTGVLQPFPVPEGYYEWQQQEYWLPLDGLFGVEGRWTGPFGHNTRAGFAAAMVVIIGVARWGRSTIPLTVLGTFFLLITSVRASYLAAIAGLLILVLFGRWGILARVPTWLRWALLAAGGILAGLGLALTGAGLTGRQAIWPTFASLIPESPLIGIGGTGITEAGGLAALREDAHNILLDELVRFGIVGFVLLIGALAVGTFVAFRAAGRGFAVGAALVTAFLITSMTDLQNDWLQLYYQSVLIVLAVIAAGQWLSDDASSEPQSAPVV